MHAILPSRIWRPQTLSLLRNQHGTIDLAGALVGTGVATALGVAVLLGYTQVVNAARDEAAKQALSALHLTQSIAHAQTGEFASAQDLEGQYGPELAQQGIGVAIGPSSYKATIVSESGVAFAIGSEKATPLRE